MVRREGVRMCVCVCVWGGGGGETWFMLAVCLTINYTVCMHYDINNTLYLQCEQLILVSTQCVTCIFVMYKLFSCKHIYSILIYP